MNKFIFLILTLAGLALPSKASTLHSNWETMPDSGITVLITGKVTDRVTNRPLAADLQYLALEVENASPQNIPINPATGEYSVEVPGGVQYRLTASAAGYTSVIKRIDLREAKPEMKLPLNLALGRDGEARRIETADPFGTLVTIVYFKENTVELTEQSRRELDRLLTLLRANPDLRLWLHGHSDANASFDINHRIGELRTQAVRAYLIAHDIAPFRLPSISYGNTRMMTTFKDDRYLNHRVEFHLWGK